MEGIEGNGQAEAVAAPRSLLRIGEVSRLTSTKPFVLRYWETEFPMLQPVKSPKGHRLYRRQDVETVLTIKRLLYDEGFTIAGARRHLRDQVLGTNGSQGIEGAAAIGDDSPAEVADHSEGSIAPPRIDTSDLAMLNRNTLLELRDSLRSLLTALESE